MPGTSEDRRASEPAAGDRAPRPAASPLAQEEALLAPCSGQGALAPRGPCAEAGRGGDAGSGLRPRAEVRSRLRERGPASLPLPAQTWVVLSLYFPLWCALHICFFVTYLPSFLFPFWLLPLFPQSSPLSTPPVWDMTLFLCQGTPVIPARADPSGAPCASSDPSLSLPLPHLS